MSLKRLLPIFLVASIAALAFVPGAAADDFADAPCFDVNGPDTATCPAGTVGAGYSLQLLLAEGSGCGPGHTTWTVSSGTFPPGLSLGSGDGVISGTPTEAGNFEFFVTVSYPVLTDPPCNGGFSDKRHTIPINPGVPQLPKLTIGPEQTGVSTGTVGSAYSLQMTANLPDPKSWSVSGQLPPGLAIDPSTGLISGTPTVAGTYTFTVQAVIDAQRSDTKTLAIVVRAPLAVTAPARVFNGTRIARTEVGLAFTAGFEATGGLGPYVWTQSGTLPSGIEFYVSDGSLTGEPEEDGTFRFTISVADAEGRTISYAGTIVVAKRLAIVTRRLKKGKVGRLYRSKLVSTGGVTPASWRIKRGPLPRGIRFVRTTGSFVGTPAKAGIWIITVQLVDALRVKATTNVVVVVAPKPKPKR